MRDHVCHEQFASFVEPNPAAIYPCSEIDRVVKRPCLTCSSQKGSRIGKCDRISLQDGLIALGLAAPLSDTSKKCCYEEAQLGLFSIHYLRGRKKLPLPQAPFKKMCTQTRREWACERLRMWLHREAKETDGDEMRTTQIIARDSA